MMKLIESQHPYPPRFELARTPTPVERLNRLSEKLGVSMYIKRDDMTGTELSGNKIRKLEFVLADAVKAGADVVLTCGGTQSNHARATAVAAIKLGLRCRLILRTPDPANPPEWEGNSLLDALTGAEIVWITPDEYKQRDEIFAREASVLTEAGRTPYIIPAGASGPVGAWGYIRAAEEIAVDIARLPEGQDPSTTIICAAGSGGTYAGLLLGTKLHALKARVVGINICDDRQYFLNVIGAICEETIRTYKLNLNFDRQRDIDIIDGYVGRGYALSRPEELALLRDVAQLEGIILDPVYTAKTFFGMTQELKKDPQAFGDRILFLHTGGLFGLFPFARELSEVLLQKL